MSARATDSVVSAELASCFFQASQSKGNTNPLL